MSVILITGGIGSGKSEVCRILEATYGLPCYNADSRVKDLYGSHPDLLDDIEKELGQSLRDSSDNFVPGLLAERIFSSDQDLKKVEALVFPVLAEDFKLWKSAQDRTDVVIESATALEKEELSYIYDVVVVVDAPFQTRLSRACARDNSDPDKVMARMRNQTLMNRISDGYSEPRVDYILDNGSDLASLKEKVAALVGRLHETRIN